MNNLKNARCYLAGAIEKATDGGMAWREQIKDELRDLGIHWLDPTNKPTLFYSECPAMIKELHEARATGHYGIVRAMLEPIRKLDLRMVDICDFVIVYLDPDVPTSGTHEEVARAAFENKPIVAIIKGGLTSAPFWWFSELNPDSFFPSIREACNHIRQLSERSVYSENTIESVSDFRWILFDWMGEK